jgi:hypothetical protein
LGGCASAPNLTSGPSDSAASVFGGSEAVLTRSSVEGAADAAAPSARPLPGDVGSSHPALVGAVAPDAGWTVICQAREDTNSDGVIEVTVEPRGKLEGDRLDAFLVEGSGSGELIQAFVANDVSGRYLVIDRNERLILRDSWNQEDVDLTARGAVRGTDRSSFAPHRAARFSSDGRRLLYLRRRGPREAVVVLDLSDGQEVVLDPGDGLLWRAEFDEAGEWVLMHVVDADTNGDGRWDWPHGKPTLLESPCTSPIPQYRVAVAPGDEPSVRAALARGGQTRQVRGFVTSFGASGLVRRPEDRSLFLDRPGAPSELLSPSRCDGRLLHADRDRGLLLLACATEAGVRNVELTGRGIRQALGLDVATFELDWVLPGQPRLVPLYPYPESPTVALDLETREVVVLEARDRVIATHGSTVLVLRKAGLFMGDARAPLALIGPVEPLASILYQAPVVFAPPWVVDLAAARVLGQVAEPGLGLAKQGAVLVARQPGDAHRLPMGPLAWIHPARSR